MGAERARRPSVVAVLTAVALAVTACTGDDAPRAPGGTAATATTAAAAARPRGGIARVAVWGDPDPRADTLGGAAARALVLPQLFRAGPDGSWLPSLVTPGTDRLSDDGRAASFRLRAGAAWSDGTPITADDLRRTADARFVLAVDGSGDRVTVRFTQRLPGWRRLWSGTDAVRPPRDGVWGGPFVVASHVSGRELVLRPNPRWYGGSGPFLDELRLLLVPDAATARQLLARGTVDVVAPLPSTNRTDQLRAIAGVRVDSGVARAGGWWVGLRTNPERLDDERRRAVVATVARDRFVSVLLAGEADVVDGFVAAADRTWARAAGTARGPVGDLDGSVVDTVMAQEEPMGPILRRAWQRRARTGGGRFGFRVAEAARVESWIRTGAFAAAVVVEWDGPVVCWRCRWEVTDPVLAAAADAGDAAAARRLEARLRDRSLLLPLWRGRPVVAWRDGLRGPAANTFALSAAWNADAWWREPA